MIVVVMMVSGLRVMWRRERPVSRAVSPTLMTIVQRRRRDRLGLGCR